MSMDGGEVAGVEIDIWNEIASRMGYKVEFEKIDFSGQFGLLDADKAIESMREDGTLSKIYNDYFGVDISEEGGN